MDELGTNQELMGLSSPTPAAMVSPGVRAAQHRKIICFILFCLVVTVFLGLRIISSPPPREWVDLLAPSEGAAIETIAPAAQHPIFGPVGLILALTALVLNRPLGFAFLVCDMLGFGQFFDLDQWGISGWFKFRDLEFFLLLAVGIFLNIVTSRVHRKPFTPLRRWLFRVGLVIPALWLLYALATLPAQPLLTTLRYTRQFSVWPLLLVVPQFIRNNWELRQVVGAMLFLILLSSVLYLLQTIQPPFTILRYSQQIFTGGTEQVRIWTATAAPFYLGGCAIFAYLMIQQKTSRWLSFLWGLCLLTVIGMLGRTLMAVYLVSTICIFFSLKGEQKNLKLLHVSAPLLGMILIFGFFLFALGRLEQLGEGWLGRLWEFQDEFFYGEQGSFAGRLGMLTNLPSVMERNGGSIINALVGMGLLALTPEQLSPMIFWGQVSPPIWADNGLAGILFATGCLGMVLFLIFIVLMVRHLRQNLGQAHGPLARSLLLALTVYFIFAPFYMFFSSHFMGGWDETLVLVIALALSERALTLEEPQRIIQGTAT